MKIPVGILGATGSVGQKFIQLLNNHPWFEISALAASEKSAGKPYAEAANWFGSDQIPENVARMTVRNCTPDLNCSIVFSGLDSGIAGEIEEDFARAGYTVISNSRNHRFDPDVPLLIPEVNPDHLELIHQQKYGNGCIVTNPNCSTIGLVLALKPLVEHFGVKTVSVTTMQALSGAGYPGVASLDIVDNVTPYISGEEEKMESEPLKIFGTLQNNQIRPAEMTISAQCNRVAVLDGHTECVSVKLNQPATETELISAWTSFTAEPQQLSLPTAPCHPVYYHKDVRYPQPKLHRNRDKGMAVHTGRLRKDPILDYKFVLLVHNTVRGAAGGAILNAELMLKKGYIKL